MSNKNQGKVTLIFLIPIAIGIALLFIFDAPAKEIWVLLIVMALLGILKTINSLKKGYIILTPEQQKIIQTQGLLALRNSNEKDDNGNSVIPGLRVKTESGEIIEGSTKDINLLESRIEDLYAGQISVTIYNDKDSKVRSIRVLPA